MTHGGLLEKKFKCNEIRFSLKTQTEIQAIFFCFFVLSEKAFLLYFFLSYLILECVFLWIEVIAAIKSRNAEIL